MRARAARIGRQIGRRIQELRTARAFTQEELAERAGISVSFVSMIERAERIPHVVTLGALAEALGVSLSDLLSGC